MFLLKEKNVYLDDSYLALHYGQKNFKEMKVYKGKDIKYSYSARKVMPIIF